MKILKHNNRGQALIMITTSLIALCGIMGLAVDLGWGYFVKKSALRAADSAALAAADQALAQVGVASTFTCGVSGLTCTTASATCSSPNNPPQNPIDAGCLYARQNGFSPNNANQNVLIDANTTNPVPTAPGVHVDYWVTVRASQQIPQLFSAVLRFPWAQSSARATAAVLDTPAPGSIYLINRECDPGPSGAGVDLQMNGGGSITSTGAVYMASTANGSVSCNGKTNTNDAGQLNGSASVTGSYVGLRGTGIFNNAGNVTPSPTNGLPDQANFRDPMTGKGQPPPPTAAEAPATPVPGGTIDGGSKCITLNPGTYYSTNSKSGKPDGNPINITGCVNFSAGSSGFGNYVFFGGINAYGPGSVLTMAPGRYVLAGVTGSQNSVYAQSNGVTVQDQTPMVGGNMVANTDPGELMVFTDANYPGLYIPPALSSMASNFVYGAVSVQMGTTSASQFNLHGLNADAAALPSELQTFAPTVLWQDQGNSPVMYDSNGKVMDATSCGGGGTLDSPCANTNSEVTTNGKNPSVDMTLQATPGLHLYGVLYQPRGAALNMQGSGSVSTPMVIITGTLSMGGSPTVLQPLTGTGLITKLVALVE